MHDHVWVRVWHDYVTSMTFIGYALTRQKVQVKEVYACLTCGEMGYPVG